MTDDDFDITLARNARDAALVQVEANAKAEWIRDARSIVLSIASQMRTFTSDDVWESGKLPETRENRALGPVMNKLSREGLIVKTGRQQLSKRRKLHASPRTEWTLASSPAIGRLDG